MIVTVVSLFVFVSLRIRQNSITEMGEPPAGQYPWLQIVVILVAFVAFMLWGYWLGYRIKSVLIPIVSAGAMLLRLQVPRQTLLEADSVSPFGAIIPTQINHVMAPFIGDRVYMPLAAWGIAWFFLLGLIPLLMLRKWGVQKKQSKMQVAVVSVLAVVCAVNVTNALESAGSWHAEYRTATCIEQSGIEYCAPPGALSITDLEAVAAHYASLTPDWFPVNRLPSTIMPVVNGDQLPADAVSMVPFQHTQERNSSGFMRALLYLIAGAGVVDVQPNAAQLVVACAMLLDSGYDCGPTYPVADFQTVPDASQSVEGQEILAEHLEPGIQPSEKEAQLLTSELGALQSLTQQKLDTFMALSDEEKIAWLDANWDRLSSGELVLEDMP
jgi:hypothetical protein